MASYALDAADSGAGSCLAHAHGCPRWLHRHFRSLTPQSRPDPLPAHQLVCGVSKAPGRISATPTHRGRPIDDVADVRAIFDSPVAGFAELLECTEVAVAQEEWRLVEEAALRALAEATERSAHVDSLSKAARAVLQAHLGRVGPCDFEGVSSAAEYAKVVLDRAAERSRSNATTRALAQAREQTGELLLLTANPDATSATQLCSRLRGLKRPDLGAMAADRALASDPDNAAAMTTRGAATADMGHFDEALRWYRGAWRLEESTQTALGATRTLIATGKHTDAMAMAGRAVDTDLTVKSARVYAMADAAADDVDALNRAHGLLQHVEDSSPDSDETSDIGRRWVLTLAAKKFLRGGCLSEAREMLEAVLSDHPDYGPAKRALANVANAERRRGATPPQKAADRQQLGQDG